MMRDCHFFKSYISMIAVGPVGWKLSFPCTHFPYDLDRSSAFFHLPCAGDAEDVVFSAFCIQF